MRLFYFKDVANFGDDLNRWIWEDLLPGFWDPSDGISFAGIGTILSRHLMPSGGKWIVFSSGAGYSPPPDDFGNAGWEIVGVRGPLSTRALNLASSKAVGDGAMLISTCRSYSPLPESKRSGIVFMPHFEMLPGGNWPAICQRAGVEYLNPLGDSRETASRIRRAKLVLADAMHAAIVADALRVPWIPLSSSVRTNTFKWLDWTLSLRCPYQPLPLPFTSLLRKWINKTSPIQRESFFLPVPSAEAALRHFRSNQKVKEKMWWKPYRKQARRMLEVVPSRLYLSHCCSALSARDRRKRIDSAAEVLVSASQAIPFLSDDGVFYEKQRAMAEGLKNLPALMNNLQRRKI